MGKKLERNIEGHERYYRRELNKDYPRYICQTQGSKMRKLRDLSLEQKLDIVDDVFIKQEYHENICARYNISRESIKSILRNMKKDHSYLRQL